jgi:UDP-N-acetylmuramate dehydrogenase
MSFPDIAEDLKAAAPELRGRLAANFDLAPITWFRVGGPAQVLFTPQDEADLAYFLASIGTDVPVQVIGLGSNLLVRDGGVSGVVIRLARGFSDITIEDGHRVRAGSAVPDVKVARAAADAAVAGLSFLRGIPGSIGGALRMNGGAYGGETRDVLVEVRAVDRRGEIHVVPGGELGMSYRHSGAPEDWIFTQALLQGRAGDRDVIAAEMDKITDAREATQPVKSRTGGSTFKNPPGGKAWQLIDAAGCRGLHVGGAQVSEQHCNFLINTGDATAADLETLGETVRARVLETSGVALEWEIKRIGAFPPGVAVEPFPRVWMCKRCSRLSTSLDKRCPCGAGRAKGQLHFVGYCDRCGALREPYVPGCQQHKQVRVVFPGTSSAREIRFDCPVCGRLVRRGFGFPRCQCGQGVLTFNVHRSASVFTPRTVVIVNAPSPERVRDLAAAGGPSRAR